MEISIWVNYICRVQYCMYVKRKQSEILKCVEWMLFKFDAIKLSWSWITLVTNEKVRNCLGSVLWNTVTRIRNKFVWVHYKLSIPFLQSVFYYLGWIQGPEMSVRVFAVSWVMIVELGEYLPLSGVGKMLKDESWTQDVMATWSLTNAGTSQRSTAVLPFSTNASLTWTS